MVGLQGQQRVRVYRLYISTNQDVRRMQICVDHQLVIDDSCVRALQGPFEINVWPSRFALFEAVGGEMIRIPQEDAVLEMETPSYFTWD